MSTPIAIDVDEDVVTQLIGLLDDNPQIFVFGSLISGLTVALTLGGIIYAISKAGTFQPPQVVLSVIAGLAALIAIVAAVIRPESEALAVAAGTAIGGIVGALGTAFAEKARRVDAEVHDCPRCGKDLRKT